jgi:hypothetical protein
MTELPVEEPTAEQKQAAQEILDKPEHQKPIGSAEDNQTTDNDLDDPTKQEDAP